MSTSSPSPSPSPHDHEPARVRVNGTEWRSTSSFDAAAGEDEVFAFDRETGAVRFGDGVHGKRPPDGSLVEISFRTGGRSVVSVVEEWPPSDRSYEVIVHADRVGVRPSVARCDGSAGVKRVRFFTGKLLDADDLRQEQEYVNQKRYLHNRALHGLGVVSGLTVSLSGGSSAPSVRVEPGLALDRCGREVLLTSALAVSVAGDKSPRYVVIDYCEHETDPAPLVSGGVAYTRIEEGARVWIAGEDTIGDGVAIARLLRPSGAWTIDASFERPRPR